MSIISPKPTAFEELRYGYFDTAFGNMLKAIRGGTNPVRFVAGGVIRSMDEIKRLQKINCLPMITPNLVEVARKGLLFGPARTLPNNFESHS